ncbi:class I SAM-dependent methyltransferase [Desulfobulbus sp. TB]|nr:class I SAM-dependent methyltransferase [Desulfobulbus sp. TB]
MRRETPMDDYTNGNYNNMADYYDMIMTSGYYDYRAISDAVLQSMKGRRLLEAGCGTGLILEKILKKASVLQVTGFDLTESMLDVAEKRLKDFENSALYLQDVTTLDLPEQYDTAFSYGGVWYFSRNDDGLFMISHISDDESNRKGFSKLAQHVVLDGHLLLGIQGPHFDYESPVKENMVYSQKITPTNIGFVKDYFLRKEDKLLMSQTINYRVYSFEEALSLLAEFGFEYQAIEESDNHIFSKFKRVS